MLNFLKTKTDDNGSVKKTKKITESDILKELYKNYNGHMIPKRLLFNMDYMIKSDDINSKYVEEEAVWANVYFEYLNEEMTKFYNELDKYADEGFEAFEKYISKRNGENEKLDAISSEFILSRIQEIANNAPKMTDTFQEKDIVSALGEAIMQTNFLTLRIPLLVIVCSRCNMCRKK